jgi:hypothetical protein
MVCDTKGKERKVIRKAFPVPVQDATRGQDGLVCDIKGKGRRATGVPVDIEAAAARIDAKSDVEIHVETEAGTDDNEQY